MSAVPQTLPECEARIQRHTFTRSEDQIIMEYYCKFGDSCWNKIKDKLQLKDARSARDRFYSYLSRNKGPFSDREDKIITLLFDKIGPKWKEIAAHLENRSPIQVRNRHRSIVAKNLKSIRDQKKSIVRVARLVEISDKPIDFDVFEQLDNYDHWNDYEVFEI